MEGSISAIERTLDLLVAVNKKRGKWFGVSDIAAMTGVPKGAVHRYLTIFVERGILEYADATRKYAVAGSVREIGAKNG